MRPLALVLLLTACEIEKVGIPQTESRIALHGVLSASATSQVVLLERTRNGSVFPIAPPFDIGDPVVTDEAAETGAIVTMRTPGGQMTLAREDNAGGGKGAGVYRFALPGRFLQRGVTYSLSVITAGGELLFAETSVPMGTADTVGEQRVFDRSRDTLLVEWPASPGARTYFVRVETPYGPLSFFTDSTRVRLPGDLRNADVTTLPRVFVPGFPQAVTVSAVDSNYYDWFRTQNDRLSGTGLVNRVRGGFGVFGSLVRLRFEDLQVVIPQPEPAAGDFRFVGNAADQLSTPYLRLELYVESRAARGDQADALTGRFQKRTTLGNPGCFVCGLLGSVKDGRIQLVFLRDWSARDTAEIFDGQIRGDTIVGSYRGFGGFVHFVKQRQTLR